MSLIKKFLFLCIIPFLVFLGIFIFTKNAIYEFKDIFIVLFSIGFFVIISFNSVYFSDYLKRNRFHLFFAFLITGIVTFFSIALFSIIMSSFFRGSIFRLTTIFSQSILGFCIFLLEYLTLNLLDKNNKKVLKFDDKKYNYFLIIISVVFIEYLLYLLIIFRDIDDFNQFLYTYKFILIYMFIVPCISFILIKKLNNFKVYGILNILISSLFSVLITFLVTSVLVLKELKFNNHIGAVIIAYLISLFSTLAIYTIVFYKNQLKESTKIKYQIIKKDAQYVELKSQINPHFLFNNLNILISLIEVNPKKAIEFGHNLSNIYRHNLNKIDEDFILLKEELTFINEYLEIYKAKFENGFTFSITNAVNNNQYILTSCIQELIDNVFKHNILDEVFPININIYIENNLLIISNLINENTNVLSNNFGLESINKRYKLLINKSIEIIKSDDKFIVKLPILEIQLK
jgi:sensor histidine kinase YesM